MQIKRIPRPTDVPDTGLLCDLLWADPDKDVAGWGENDRGVSYTFGPDSIAEFLRLHELDLICRAHQVRGQRGGGCGVCGVGGGGGVWADSRCWIILFGVRKCGLGCGGWIGLRRADGEDKKKWLAAEMGRRR